MKLTVEIEMDNAAFEESGVGVEAARILRVAASKVEEDETRACVLKDVNGNTVGRLEVTL